jgi:hypothetical protein
MSSDMEYVCSERMRITWHNVFDFGLQIEVLVYISCCFVCLSMLVSKYCIEHFIDKMQYFEGVCR